MFRFACQLNERVEQEILQQATEKTLETFPIFRSVLKHGLFWYYLEKTDLVPVVEPEYRPACGPLYDPASRNLLFEVTCWRNRAAIFKNPGVQLPVHQISAAVGGADGRHPV